jgi:predicted DNA-binding transcriptional regulator AlpA
VNTFSTSREGQSKVLLSEVQLAEQWGISRITLRKWREAKKGPPYVRLGRSIRYPEDSATKWQNSRTVAA